MAARRAHIPPATRVPILAQRRPRLSAPSGPVTHYGSSSLNLTLVITNDGATFKASGGNISTGCDSVGAGMTFPSKGKDASGEPVLDADAITACARKLKDSSPDFKEETQIRITASNGISYRKVIECIDAVRKDKSGNDLFPDVLFGVPR